MDNLEHSTADCNGRVAEELIHEHTELVEVPQEHGEDDDEFDVRDVKHAVIRRLENSGKLKPFFLVTVHEYRNSSVLDMLKADSRLRGFSDCKTADDDGVRRHYFDDSEFVDRVALFASGIIGDENTTCAQDLLCFLTDGGLERKEVRLYDAETTAPAYMVEYEFSGVDWTQFNWEQAIGGRLYLADKCTFGEAVRTIVGLFDAI